MVADALGPGDQVVGVVRFGAYADAVNADVQYLRTLPEGWSFTEGAAFPVQALTAWHGLHTLGGLQSGGSILVHSAAGGCPRATRQAAVTVPDRPSPPRQWMTTVFPALAAASTC